MRFVLVLLLEVWPWSSMAPPRVYAVHTKLCSCVHHFRSTRFGVHKGSCRFKEWCLLHSGLVASFQWKIPNPHTIVVRSQDYSVLTPQLPLLETGNSRACVSFQAGISDTMTIQSKWLRLHEKDYSASKQASALLFSIKALLLDTSEQYLQA